ncbi:MAG: class I SAM-dependent methyltransferase [Acidiferrobacterales bacterium]
MFARWRRYLAGHPEYLVRHYWWAYLSPLGAWFFDHRPIINAILFGQYARIMQETLRRYCASERGRTLQLASVYGDLTPTLVECTGEHDFHLMDVAAIQLLAARRKLQLKNRALRDLDFLARMNAESLAYTSNGFDTVVIYFLLHELPKDARRRTLTETLRVLRPGGRLILAEYGTNANTHLLHRFPPFRWALQAAEPYLGNFWHQDLTALLRECGESVKKQVNFWGETPIFGGFYRVAEYHVQAH